MLTTLVVVASFADMVILLKVGFANRFKDNISGTLVIGVEFLIITLLLLLTFHASLNLLDPEGRKLSKWISKNHKLYILPMLLVSALTIVYSFLQSSAENMDKFNCVSHE